MPRNPKNTNEFIAGQLPTISFQKKQYYVDGRMKIVRNINNFMDELDVDSVWGS